MLTGDRDLRTPVANALALAPRFRNADVTIVPGVGHSVLSGDFTSCAATALGTWLAGAIPPSRCPRVAPLVAPLAAFPASVAALTPMGGRGLPGKTLNAAVRTIREAGASWTLVQAGFGSPPAGVAGPYGGVLRATSNRPGFRLIRYSAVPGVELSGTLELERGPFRAVIPFRFLGSVTVGGAKAARGRLEVESARISGRLAGRRVSART